MCRNFWDQGVAGRRDEFARRYSAGATMKRVATTITSAVNDEAVSMPYDDDDVCRDPVTILCS